MRTTWRDGDDEKQVIAPVSLIVSAAAPVLDVRKTVTPQLQPDVDGGSVLLLVDLAQGKNRLGGSALAQIYRQLGDQAPDLDNPALLKGFFKAVQQLLEQGDVVAYHDRSDGGLFTTLCEMAFAGRVGIDVQLDALNGEPLAVLFSEELGAVLQVKTDRAEDVLAVFAEHGLQDDIHVIGAVNSDDVIRFYQGSDVVLENSRIRYQRAWSETSYRMQALRDNPKCAAQEFDALLDADDPGLHARLGFAAAEDVAAPFIRSGARPRIAILREQGVNGQYEMAAAFDRAGFECRDVHMSDILEGRVSLHSYVGLAACGGFSYGDVLGAGGGWAKTVLFNDRARDEFAGFFQRRDTFALGVCNGCQMLSNLRELIPGADHWPRFVRNLSEQYEARLVMAEVADSPSILLEGMAGSRMPIVVAHGEGRAECRDETAMEQLLDSEQIALRYVDNYGRPSDTYPSNPNGSPHAIAGLTSTDGRVTVMMPHPERVFRSIQHSWSPSEWGEDGPWMRLFRNARVWLG